MTTSSSRQLLHIPHDVLRCMQPYCTAQQWRQFVQTCVSLQTLCTETRLLHFTVNYSQRYLANTDGFRDYILSTRVKHARKQISLTLTANQMSSVLQIDCEALLVSLTCQSLKTIVISAHLSGLVLKYCSSLELLLVDDVNGGRVEDLQVLDSPKTQVSLHNATASSVSAAKSCVRLSLQDCPLVLDYLYQFTALKSLSLSGHRITQDMLVAVQFVPHLSLHFCSQLKDISMLGSGGNQYLSFLGCCNIIEFPRMVSNSLKTFCISENVHISDLSVFRELTSITLQECPNVVDVSPLRDLQYVDLTCCDGVSDVSTLGKVRKLILHGCVNVSDVSALSAVAHLNLADMPQLTHISMLDRVKHLVINDSVNICSIASSSHLRVLHIENLPPLPMLPTLPNLTKLRITDQTIPCVQSTFPCLQEGFFMRCDIQGELSALTGLQRLTLVDCLHVDLSQLRGIPTVALINSHIEDLSPLQDCKEVFLGNCAEIVDVDALSKVEKVRLIYCSKVCDVSPLANVTELHLIGCPAIKDLSALRGVHVLHLSICQGLDDIDMLTEIGSIYLLSTKRSLKGGDILQNVAIED